MLNSASKRSRPAQDAPADAHARPARAPAAAADQRFGPREQQSLLEAAYGLPEPAVGEYSGAVKATILIMGCVAGWGVVFGLVMAVRFVGGL